MVKSATFKAIRLNSSQSSSAPTRTKGILQSDNFCFILTIRTILSRDSLAIQNTKTSGRKYLICPRISPYRSEVVKTTKSSSIWSKKSLITEPFFPINKALCFITAPSSFRRPVHNHIPPVDMPLPDPQLFLFCQCLRTGILLYIILQQIAQYFNHKKLPKSFQHIFFPQGHTKTKISRSETLNLDFQDKCGRHLS